MSTRARSWEYTTCVAEGEGQATDKRAWRAHRLSKTSTLRCAAFANFHGVNTPTVAGPTLAAA